MPVDAHHGTSLEAVGDLLGDCGRCALGATRGRVVTGSGDPHARVLIIGEAPGRQEDLQGVPFVGAAGKLLDELLAHAGLSRERVYITNVLKCRPPDNRNPKAEEIAACEPFLREQIRLIAPEIIVTLGNFATRFVLGTRQGITEVRGRVHEAGDLRVLPVYHPAAALYDVRKRAVLLDDFALLRELLDRFDQEKPST